ncbi:MAG: aldo/keto reductase [Deltaproteobacteria bacterium]|nr:aldo/keto reductase [Deltaproteobacteria bacterium]
MRYRKLGSTGFDVSVVAMGTWAIGGRDWGRVDDGDSIKAIRRAMDLGVNLFDTAPLYGDGHAEEVLGEALGPSRKDVFLATKCGPIEIRPGSLKFDLSPEGIREQCEGSLRRLRTDWVDLLQVHWVEAAWPIDDAVRAMQDLVIEGKVRAIGVCNTTIEDLHKAFGAGAVTLQSSYNLLKRKAEEAVLPFCREKGLGFLAYEPLARGLLTGRFEEGRRLETGDVRLKDPRFHGEEFLLNLDAAKRLTALARRSGISPAQLATAWVVAQPGVTTAIFGAKTAAQAVEDARAADEELDDETIREAEEAMGG